MNYVNTNLEEQKKYASPAEKAFLDLFEIYKKNKENVPEGDLKGRYAKAYNELLKELAEATRVFLLERAFACIRFSSNNYESLLDELCGIAKNAIPAVEKSVFDDMDLVKCYQLLFEVTNQVYGQWWTLIGEKMFIEDSVREREKANQ